MVVENDNGRYVALDGDWRERLLIYSGMSLDRMSERDKERTASCASNWEGSWKLGEGVVLWVVRPGSSESRYRVTVSIVTLVRSIHS